MATEEDGSECDGDALSVEYGGGNGFRLLASLLCAEEWVGFERAGQLLGLMAIAYRRKVLEQAFVEEVTSCFMQVYALQGMNGVCREREWSE